jgi:aminopeptidase N
MHKKISTSSCKINIFATDSTLTDNDFNRLGRKIIDCIDYFSMNIAPYRSTNLNIVETEWYGSTYLGNVAFVDKSSFRTYTLFHEIVHEWTGGQIEAKKDSKGEYLLNESLNEYLTLQFLKSEDGDSLYNVAIKNCVEGYKEYLKDNEDMSIWDVTKYVKSTHPIIMYKQVILLDELAKTVGYDKFNAAVFEFLKSVIGKPVETSQFLEFLKEAFGHPVIDYCSKI